MPDQQFALTLARIFDDPDLNGESSQGLRFSPDGKLITYLKNNPTDHECLDLYCYVVATSETRLLVPGKELDDERILSNREKANRERKRISQDGITEYHWSPDGKRLVFPKQGELYLYSVSDDLMERASVTRITEDGQAKTDLHFSADGKYLAYVQSGNIWVIEPDTGAIQQLTFDGQEDGPVSNGSAEFIAQEEMHRFDGYWWSPDASRIAFLRVDESGVDVSQRYEINASSFQVYDQRYPFAGTPNARIELAVVNLESQEITPLPIDRQECYIARVNWLADNHLVVQVQSRLQDMLELIGIDTTTLVTRTLLTEHSEHWINLNNHFRSLQAGTRFLWGSEQTGHLHLSLHDSDGKLLQQITQGAYQVTSVKHVTDDLIYFEGTRDSILESHLYSVPTDGSEDPLRLTAPGYFHETVLSPKGDAYIDRSSSPQQPISVSLNTIPNDRPSKTLIKNVLDEGHPFFPYRRSCVDISFGNLEAEDGQTLHYRLIPPTKREPHKTYPVILTVYGGPGAQLVTHQWVAPWHHYMAQRGFGLLQLDNRGSANRGAAFEKPIHGQLGDVEVSDQLRGISMLRELDWVDAERLGVFGHSYGGYMTLMLMMKAPSVFRAGVSVAPVTDWRLYDTHYTERYLGLPVDHSGNYEKSSVFPYVDGLESQLLLIHGMADDNVLFTHSTRLYKALQDHNLAFSMMNYPGAKHGITGRVNNLHRYTTMDAFFDRHLNQPALS